MDNRDKHDNEKQADKAVLKESRQEQAVEAFLGGCNCAQAVFSTYADLFGIDRQTAMNLTNSLGGGISRLREVCGTVSAMALLTGLAEGDVEPTDLKARERVYKRTRDLTAKFEEENSDLLGTAAYSGTGQLLASIRADAGILPEAPLCKVCGMCGKDRGTGTA